MSASKDELRMLLGLTIERSPYLPAGMIVWKTGSEVLGWISAGRQKFWRQFGFAAKAPHGCTGIQISDVDYEILTQDLAEHLALAHPDTAAHGPVGDEQEGRE